MSPYLFILCSEFFLLFCIIVHNHLLKAYSPCQGPIISHVFYADDYLIVERAMVKEAACLVVLLDAYCYHSGQVVIYTKLHITFSPSTPSRIKSQIDRILNVSEHSLPWQYLGVSMSTKPLCQLDFSLCSEK